MSSSIESLQCLFATSMAPVIRFPMRLAGTKPCQSRGAHAMTERSTIFKGVRQARQIVAEPNYLALSFTH